MTKAATFEGALTVHDDHEWIQASRAADVLAPELTGTRVEGTR